MEPKASTVISLSVAPSGQNVLYTEILARPSGTKLRIRIVSNPYATQSYAVIEHWRGGEWIQIHSLTPMKTPIGLYVSPESKRGADAFKADRDELYRVALAVLS